ncbi:MAG TPA: hypothetical protein VG692_06040 [Gemmatimonadales bacterium]|nr:hypothetical protein [Gemmatimonadales bacterium]
MNRLLLVLLPLTLLPPAVAPVRLPVLAYWKESGWIGTCPGMGCMGNRALCSIYSMPNPEGQLVKHYCYLNP